MSTPFSFTMTLQALVAVMLFSLSVPATDIALADVSANFIGAFRTALAGILALLYCQLRGWPWPPRAAIPWLLLCTFGTVFTYPYLLGHALERISAANTGVVLAALPLLTAVLAALLQRQKLSRQFCFWAVLGMVASMAYFTFATDDQPLTDNSWDLFVLIALLLCGALGYAGGAQAAGIIGGWQTVCWALIFGLPCSVFIFGWQWGLQPSGISSSSWLALLYAAIINQWLAFLFWYRALAYDAASLSQLQLLQPLFTLFAVTIWLGHSVSTGQWLLCLVIMACVTAALHSRHRTAATPQQRWLPQKFAVLLASQRN